MSLFISFEGIDGCGKSTQIELLRSHLESIGQKVVTTREPGGTALAEMVRNYLLHSDQPLAASAELLLFGAARAQHVAEVIAPALERGDIVLCDRYTDSTRAYQGSGLGLDINFINRMNDFATGEVQPNLTFLLDIEPALGAQRLRDLSSGDRIEARGLEFAHRVRLAFLAMARAEPNRIVVLDGTAPAKIVHQHVFELLQERLLKSMGGFSR